MPDKAPERIWVVPVGVNERRIDWSEGMWTVEQEYCECETSYVPATALEAAQARIAELEAERDEARRRRDEWRKKAEGYDAVRLALREKVGAPWPPSLSRAMWAGIAADEKKRADDAEAAASTARAEALEEAAKVAELAPYKRGTMICGCSEGLSYWTASAAIRALKDKPND